MLPSSPKTRAAFPQISQHPSPDRYYLLTPHTCPCPISDVGLCITPPASAPLPHTILPHGEGLDITALFFFFRTAPSRAERRPQTTAETHTAIIKNKSSFTYRKSAKSDCFHFVPKQSHKPSFVPRAKIFTVVQ